mmetsp:Transcript_152035/g.264981  ORF Transcript_152035/g.264981 Transcript_152035/m.264981 type:complete len:454 (+) Transcript_152035:79-1440(+)
MTVGNKPTLVVAGGGFAGMLACRNMRKHFNIILIDAKDYFEYVPSIPRAFVDPEFHSEISFQYQSVCDAMKIKFLWGELKKVDPTAKTVDVACMAELGNIETVKFDYLLICCGCQYTMFATHEKSASSCNESLWYPTLQEEIVKEMNWGQLDERYVSGRRLHIEREAGKIKDLAAKKGTIVVVGAGPVGVEFATEAKHAYPDLNVVLLEQRDKCLPTLPDRAIKYVQNWMDKHGIKSIYNVKYANILGAGNSREGQADEFEKLGIKPDRVYICVGTLAVNGFLDKTYLIPSSKPGRGGQIKVNHNLQVIDENKNPVPCVFAAGTCCIMQDFEAVAGKVAPAEEQAKAACHNIEILEKMKTNSGGCLGMCKPKGMIPFKNTGMTRLTIGFDLTSVGPHDATFVAFNHASKSGSGCFVWGGCLASILKETFIGWTKVDQCRQGWRGKAFWSMVGH